MSSTLFYLAVLLLAVTFDTGSGIDVEFIMNSTSAHVQDMTCSINGNEDTSQISGIVQIDIFAILENSEQNLASINFISQTPITPSQDESEAIGKLSGKEGFLRLKIKADHKVLMFSCKVLALDKNRETVRVEKLQKNKANLLMSMLNQRFAGISSGVDLNGAFQKMEDKLEETYKALINEIGAKENNTGETVSDVLDIVKSMEDNGRTILKKLSISEERENNQFQLVKNVNVKVDALSQNLETFTNFFEKMSETQTALERDMKQISNRIEEMANETEAFRHEYNFHSCGDYRDNPIPATSPRDIITTPDGVRMMCDTKTNGGGWIVFQRRINGSVNFYRNWADYENGFGRFGSDFWLGLSSLSAIVAKGRWELRIELETKGKRFYAEYSQFKIGDASTNYKLSISGFSGNASDSLAYHNGMAFSTFDRDNDKTPVTNCAERYTGAWWFNDCHTSDLNGQWGSKEFHKGVRWNKTTPDGQSATFTEMKIRMVQLGM